MGCSRVTSIGGVVDAVLVSTNMRVCHKFMTHPLFVEVELEGIEPSSAQGNHTLSTRLFQPLIFEV